MRTAYRTSIRSAYLLELAEIGTIPRIPFSPASTLGAARGSAGIDPQQLKRLWHCVAAFGRAGGPGSR